MTQNDVTAPRATDEQGQGTRGAGVQGIRRVDYAGTGLDEATLGDSPWSLASTWLAEAVAHDASSGGHTEPDCLDLATVGNRKRPGWVQAVKERRIARQATADYLVDKKLPARGARCEDDPKPA